MTKNYAAILTGKLIPVTQRIVLTVFVWLLTLSYGKAQFRYSISTSKEAYQPLSSATSLNDTTIWYDEDYKIPLGFTFDMNGMKMDSISIVQGNLLCKEAENFPITGFAIFAASLQDRGNLGDTMSMSPIRYQIDGIAGNRIVKIEMFNAGFEDEETIYGTQDDSANFQVWVYEATSVVEFRYGPSKVTHPSDYFLLGIVIGYLNKMQIDGSADGIYFLSGDLNAPFLDSVQNLTSISNSLDSFPPDGTVYKFTPLPTGIKYLEGLRDIKVYPTVCKEKIYLSGFHTRIRYKLLSIDGKVMAEGNIDGSTGSIDMDSVPEGMYILHLYNNEGTKAVRINRI